MLFKNYIKTLLLVILMATTFSISSDVLAQAVAPANGAELNLTLSDTDQSAKLLHDVFGVGADGSLPSGADSDGNNLGAVLGVLNSIILMVGGVLLAYTLIIGTMQTAHDGEMMGKKWSTVWVPIRTALGIAAVFPMANGFSMIQGLVLWFAMQGAGAANLVWNTFLEKPAAASQSQVKSNTAPIIRDMASNMLRSSICNRATESVNYKMAKPFDAVVNPEFITTSSISAVKGANSILYNYNIKQASAPSVSIGACGNVSITYSGLSELNFVESDNTAATIKKMDVASQKVIDFKREIATIHATQSALLSKKMDEIAVKFVANSNKIDANSDNAAGDSTVNISDNIDYNADVDAAVKEYSQALGSAAKSYSEQSSADIDARDAMKKDGWLFAGTYYMAIINLQNAAQQAMKFSYNSSEPLIQSSEVNDFQNSATTIIFNANNTESGTGNIAAVQGNHTDKNGSSLLSWDTIKDGFEGISQWIIEVVGIDDIFTPPTSARNEFYDANVISNLAKQGHTMISGGAFVLSATIGGLVTASLAEGGKAGWLEKGVRTVVGVATLGASVAVEKVASVTGETLSNMMPIIMLLCLGIIGLGLTFAVYIPMLPYILWFGAIFGWLILVIEAVVAAPLWAIIHIHPHGDDFAGKGSNGYNLLLSLTIRPTLMIVGFLFAIVLINPVGSIINQTFYTAYAFARGDHMAGLIVSLGFAGVYIGLMVGMFNKIFSLIHIIPDQILRWVGVGGDNMIGQQAKASEGATQNMYGAAIRQTQSAGNNSSQIQNNMANSAQREKQGKAQVEGMRTSAMRAESKAQGAEAVAADNPSSVKDRVAANEAREEATSSRESYNAQVKDDKKLPPPSPPIPRNT